MFLDSHLSAISVVPISDIPAFACSVPLEMRSMCILMGSRWTGYLLSQGLQVLLAGLVYACDYYSHFYSYCPTESINMAGKPIHLLTPVYHAYVGKCYAVSLRYAVYFAGMGVDIDVAVGGV